jgi:hypothetical protein
MHPSFTHSPFGGDGAAVGAAAGEEEEAAAEEEEEEQILPHVRNAGD